MIATQDAGALSEQQLRAVLLLREDVQTDEQIAEACGVARRTLARWKNREPFRSALSQAEEPAEEGPAAVEVVEVVAVTVEPPAVEVSQEPALEPENLRFPKRKQEPEAESRQMSAFDLAGLREGLSACLTAAESLRTGAGLIHEGSYTKYLQTRSQGELHCANGAANLAVAAERLAEGLERIREAVSEPV